MVPKFGTSGLRGLVVELTPTLVADHLRAFCHSCPIGTGLYVGRDLRASSPALADVVIATARSEGIAVTDCGAVPTPALALAAMAAGAAAVMVTGSHIPADRNGLKFYVPDGEITKYDETAILASLGRPAGTGPLGAMAQDTAAGGRWVHRYLAAFGPDALLGFRVGVWSHSAVSRAQMIDALSALGATVIEVGWSETFLPVDTEAVPDWARQGIRGWVSEHALDALVSTDGDGDRPLLADETGAVIPGDILGQITAQAVRAEAIVTPVTSNSGAELGQHFARVVRTKVGSPFVIAGMGQANGNVVGYEANGGFLLGFDAQLRGPLAALATRDSLLPLIATLVEARAAGGVAKRVAQEPARFTATDRIENVPTEAAQAFVRTIAASDAAMIAFLAPLGERLVSTDLTDGLRLICASGNVIHLRPSGNAPALRVYVEAGTMDAAALLGTVLASLTRQV